MNPEQNEIRLRALLRSGAQKPGGLLASLGVSQPTLSRLIRRAGQDIVKLGATRSTLYALASPIPGVGSEIPVYQVQVTGNVHPYGTLFSLAGPQYYWTPVSGRPVLWDHLPWFIQNIRPEGFLGRAFAHKHCGSDLPARLEDWNDHRILTALVKEGSDLPGNLIIGELALATFLASVRKGPTPVSTDDRPADYPRLAKDSLAGSPPGSSAGGEHPKFGVTISENGFSHVLVKFSPPVGTPEGRRWSDLLMCEHIALQILEDAGRGASTSRIFQFGDRCFLEVERFDRVGRFGRRGVVSLGILEDEFFGVRDHWEGAAGRLQRAGHITAEDASAIRWQSAFGKMIANTDQHFGNISFFTEDSGFRLCPAYDVLPMFYRPSGSGEIVERHFEMPTPTSALAQEWEDAQQWAKVFWERVSRDARISTQFRKIASEHVKLFTADQGPRLILS